MQIQDVPFKPKAVLTAKQIEAQQIFVSDSTYIMAFGGSRSAKTTLIVRNIVVRAILAPKSRHVILRLRFNHVKESIVLDTFPKVMSLFFPSVEYNINKTDYYATLPNGSEIWFGGLDDKQRVEKILGKEFCTIFLNECSQISWESVEIVKTRLAQKVYKVINGKQAGLLKNRMYFDCNPPNNAHWTYKLFIKKQHPVNKEQVLEQDDYASILMNPADNLENLDENYIKTLEGLSGHNKQRFLFGQFADANPDAMFNYDNIDAWRCVNDQVPQLIRIIVGVDPSGADENSVGADDIGIAVVGLGKDGNLYVLEDCTVNGSPAVWGSVATTAFDRHQADCIVGEINYGGAMVKQTIQVARPRTPFQAVTASRGKHVRAEPISSLYELGKVRHVGYFTKLEDELCAFTRYGYIGSGSPNRADALIWAISSLMPQATNKKEPVIVRPVPIVNHFNR